MVERDQARPLAPATDRSSSDNDEAALHIQKLRRKRCVKWCGCVAALLLIQAVVILILIFTVFRVKDPVIKMNGVTVTKLELINGTTPKPGSNMSLTADVSVKNPNVASFKYKNTTTTLFYHGMLVGEARGPPGQAKPRRTMRMNITVDIITDQLLSNPNLAADLKSEVLSMSSYSRIPGRVKMIGIIKKHVVVKMNCTFTVNITSQAIQSQKCKRKVSL
ncbi:uncharacterized protein LOC121252723 [Juglans microcarpa x Juglans regia]|uniref:uncharacterized protein LOC121252723 n=1 Tax=Juglans microcarpa x Juglans regia TaxID=2249226 RepID=UPI001B7E3B81|nr:uncharacterized protein LOC121252723 [Juglans microcarpa x Juglans regia]